MQSKNFEKIKSTKFRTENKNVDREEHHKQLNQSRRKARKFKRSFSM